MDSQCINNDAARDSVKASFYRFDSIHDVARVIQDLTRVSREVHAVGVVLVSSKYIYGNIACSSKQELRQLSDRLQSLLSGSIQVKFGQFMTQKHEAFHVRNAEELFSLSSTIPIVPQSFEFSGKPLSPWDFHNELASHWSHEICSERGFVTAENEKKKFSVVDVRAYAEYRAGRFMQNTTRDAEKAVNARAVLSQHWESDIAREGIERLRSERVLLYCNDGFISKQAELYLRSRGVADVGYLDGGILRYLDCIESGGYFVGFFSDKCVLAKLCNQDSNISSICQQGSCSKSAPSISCDRVCTVCLSPVLVCDECYACLNGVYFCQDHAFLKGAFEPFLERFGINEMNQQRHLLENLAAWDTDGTTTDQIKRIDKWIEFRSSVGSSTVLSGKGKSISNDERKSPTKFRKPSRVSIFGLNPRCRHCGLLGPLHLLSSMNRQIGDQSLCCKGECNDFFFSGFQRLETSLDYLNDPNYYQNLKNGKRTQRKRKARNKREFLKRLRDETSEEFRNVEYDIVRECPGNDKIGVQILRRVKPYIYEFRTHVKDRWSGCNLLDMYCAEFSGNTREYYSKAIDLGLIAINGRRCTSDYILKSGDLLSNLVHKHEPDVVYLPGPDMVVDETEDLLVVDKPASLTIHPSGAFRRNSLTFVLAVECGFKSLHPIHRLDRLTSGLVVFAKDAETAKGLCDAMRRKTTSQSGSHAKVRKVYFARVEGRFPETKAAFDQLKIMKATQNIEFSTHCKEEHSYLSKAAIRPTGIYWDDYDDELLSTPEIPAVKMKFNTHVGHLVISWPLYCICKSAGVWACVKCSKGDFNTPNGQVDEEFNEQTVKYSMSRLRQFSYDPLTNTSIVQCEPVTGRTHQLRVHLSFLGYPICNDPLYGSAGNPLAGFTMRNLDSKEVGPSNDTDMTVSYIPIPSVDSENDSKELLAKRMCSACVNGVDVAFTKVQRQIEGIDLHAYRYQIVIPGKEPHDFRTKFPVFMLS